MSPSSEINGNLPSPLKTTHKDSTLIKTTAAASTTSLASSSSSISSTSHRQPVIIYTHSPKVIHTQPCDFMALVQKLTGFSSSSNDDNNNPILPSPNNDNTITPPVNKKRKTSIGKKEEESIKPSLDDTKQLMPSQLPSVTTNLELNPLLSDVPLFTQGFSSEFVDMHNSIYKYTEPPGTSPMSDSNNSTSEFSDI